jgi:TP901 family phage tail tape measure protein
MRAFTIPTVFTAIDKFTGPVNKMADSMNKMEKKVQEVGSQAAEIAKGSAVIGLAIAAPLAVAVNSAIAYEEELANLQALTGVAGAQFEKFKGKIEEVANASGKGFTETAQAFTAIANNQPELVKSAEALGAVTQATITLAKASKMELEPAGKALTQILNQFGLDATYAEKAINILAAGSVAGSSEIIDSAEAIQKFGTVAANAGVKLDESIAMIELVSKFDKGAEAGTKLRNILIKMGNIKVLSKDAQKDIAKAGINMGVVSDATLPLATRLKEVSKILKVQSGVTHVFEAENQALATGLLTNVDNFEEYLSKVNTAGAANEMAATATNTLANRMQVLQAKSDNISITLGEVLMPILTKLADKLIPILTGFTDWAKRNRGLLGTIVKTAAAIAALSFAISAFSTIVVLVTKGIVAYNFTLGLLTAANILSSEAIWTNTVAMNGFVFGLKAAQVLMNPYVLALTGIVALTVGWYYATRQVSAAQKAANAIQNRALENTIDQRIEVSLLFQALKKATVGSKEFGDILTKIDALQPGIVKQYNLQAGALDMISKAEQNLTSNIIKRAEAEAKAEMIKEKMRDFMTSQMQGPSLMDKFYGAILPGFNATDLFNKRQGIAQKEITDFSNYNLPSANPQKAKQDSLAETIQTNKATVDLNILDPNNRTSASTSAPFVKIKTSSTMGAQNQYQY